MLRLAVPIFSTLILSACAVLPNIQITYFPPIAHTKVTVTQALDCDKNKQQIFAANSVAQVTTFSGDHRLGHERTFQMSGLDGNFSDTNLTFTLTEDGRLKTVNAETTGEAGAVVTSAITLAGAVVALGGGGPPVAPPTACDIIADWGKDKSVSLVYSATLDSDSNYVSGDVRLTPSPDSQDLYDALKGFKLPELDLILRVGAIETMTPVAADLGSSKDVIPLTLNKTANVRLAVLAHDKPLWNQDVIIPTTETYSLPIPKSALFGKETFALTLSDSGAVTSVTYAKLTGVSSALSAAGAVATAEKPPSAADRAADLKGQADEIAQLSRLARCRANPTTCT